MTMNGYRFSIQNLKIIRDYTKQREGFNGFDPCSDVRNSMKKQSICSGHVDANVGNRCEMFRCTLFRHHIHDSHQYHFDHYHHGNTTVAGRTLATQLPKQMVVCRNCEMKSRSKAPKPARFHARDAGTDTRAAPDNRLAMTTWIIETWCRQSPMTTRINERSADACVRNILF